MNLDKIGQFTLLLPDSPVAEVVTQRLGALGNLRLHHPSGRPWLIAQTGVDPLIHGTHGSSAIAMTGPSSASAEDLAGLLSSSTDAVALARRASLHDGSFILLARTPSYLIARGPAMQTRRVFTTQIHGAHFASDRADVLAKLGGFSLDETRTRMHLALGLPSPINDLPVWSEVESIPGDECIILEPDGTSIKRATWWMRPAPVNSRREGARRLREALEAAVRARTWRGDRTVADLSGGLDSTPVCYFASQGPQGCIARTYYSDQPGGQEDLLWAKKALDNIHGVSRHLISSVDDQPEFFGGLDTDIFPDEPTQAAMAAPRYLDTFSHDRDVGAEVHLTGVGGDHLFQGLPHWEKAIFHKSPRLALQRIRQQPLLQGYRITKVIKELRSKPSYQQWYIAALKRAEGGALGSDQLPIPRLNDWSVPIHVVPWLTDEAWGSIAESLHSEVDRLQPLAKSATEHFDLYIAREGSKIARGIQQFGEQAGVRVDAPLLDDHVVEAILSVAYEERDSPREWKPLIKEAMSGLLPRDYLERTTKVGGGPQSIRGFRNNYRNLFELWEETGLFENQILDKDRLIADLPPDSVREPSRFVFALTNTALFLRSVKRRMAQETTR